MEEQEKKLYKEEKKSSIKEAMGIIDGYELNTIGNLKARKEELFEEIVPLDENIMEECKQALKQSGCVYAYIKDKKIKAIYLFEENKEEKILKDTKVLYTEEISDELKERFDNRLTEEFKEQLLLLEYKKVFLKENVIQIDPKKSQKEIYLALLGGAAVGFMLGWICLDDILFGFMWAIIFAGMFSGLDVVISKKRGRKPKNNA